MYVQFYTQMFYLMVQINFKKSEGIPIRMSKSHLYNAFMLLLLYCFKLGCAVESFLF